MKEYAMLSIMVPYSLFRSEHGIGHDISSPEGNCMVSSVQNIID